MQGDLISRVRLRTEVDLLLEDKMISPNTMAMLHRLIDGQPTAYSVEKVEKQIHDYKCKKCRNILGTMSSDEYCEIVKCEVWEICKMVRNGGKE